MRMSRTNHKVNDEALNKSRISSMISYEYTEQEHIEST